MERQENYLHPSHREALKRFEPLLVRVDVLVCEDAAWQQLVGCLKAFHCLQRDSWEVRVGILAGELAHVLACYAQVITKSDVLDHPVNQFDTLSPRTSRRW